MFLFVFIIRIYHDARSSECQIHYNFVMVSLFPTWLSIYLIHRDFQTLHWATFCFTVNLSFHFPQSLVILCSEKGQSSSLEAKAAKKEKEKILEYFKINGIAVLIYWVANAPPVSLPALFGLKLENT